MVFMGLAYTVFTDVQSIMNIHGLNYLCYLWWSVINTLPSDLYHHRKHPIPTTMTIIIREGRLMFKCTTTKLDPKSSPAWYKVIMCSLLLTSFFFRGRGGGSSED